MARARRVDANQAAIVAALRKAGASVQPIHDVGRGVPDLLVGYRARNFLIECKIPGEGLNDLQRCWLTAWRGQGCVAHSAEEALLSIGALRRPLPVGDAEGRN